MTNDGVHGKINNSVFYRGVIYLPKPFINDATDRLMECAKAEFLKKGYQDASLRSIAADAGVSTYTLYSRFRDKASLFAAVVHPAIEKYVNTFAEEMDLFNHTCPNLPYDEMTQYMLNRIHVLVDVIYDDFDTFYVLATNTESMEYENFIHQLGDIQTRQSVRYFDTIENDEMLSIQISPELLHLTYTAQFSGMFEVVRHNMSKERGLEYFTKLQSFFFAGYRALMGFDS